MELKEFVKETLTAIVSGVAEAQDGDAGGNISPSMMAGGSSQKSSWGLGVSPVKFDVALTVTDSGKAEGGGKISVMWVSAGASVESANERQSVSRVQFEVPVAMPTTKKKPLHNENE